MRRYKYPLIAVTIGCIIIMTTAGCSGNPAIEAPSQNTAADDTYNSFDSMEEGDRMNNLVEAAEDEGTVTVYLRADNVFAELESAFEERYDVDLQILNPGTVQAVQQQLVEQSKADKVEADVVETYVNELDASYTEANIVSEMPKFLAEAGPDPELASKSAIETFQYPFLSVWNTNATTDAQVPGALSDLARPSWNDGLIMVKNYESWYMTEFQRLRAAGLSIEEFESLFKTLAENSNTADSSNPAAAGIASGQYKAGVGIALIASQKLGNDAPVQWEPTKEPVSVVPAGIGMLKQASHPAAAMLFADWYLNEGSDILEKEQFVSQNTNEKDLEGAELVRFDTEDLDSERISEWRTAYENLLNGSDDILPGYVK